MPKFPVDAPKMKVMKALEALGFQLVREGNHISMARENPNGTRTPQLDSSFTIKFIYQDIGISA